MFAGGGIGLVASRAKIDSSGSVAIGNSTMPSDGISVNGQGSNKDTYSEYGPDVHLFVGYGKTFNSFYLGGEIFGDAGFTPYIKDDYTFLADKSGSQYPINVEAKTKNLFAAGGDAIIGYLNTPRSMIYLLIGLDVGYWKSKVELSDGGSENIVPTVTDNFNKWRAGIMPGFGVAAAITDHLALRMQYTYTFYQSFSHTTNESGITQVGHTSYPYDVSLKTKITPDKGLFTVMLSYLF